jgi:hypothetical protein
MEPHCKVKLLDMPEKVELTEHDKRTSLGQNVIIYCHKKYLSVYWSQLEYLFRTVTFGPFYMGPHFKVKLLDMPEKTELTERDKHTCLRRKINYCRKRFYNTCLMYLWWLRPKLNWTNWSFFGRLTGGSAAAN